MATTDPRPRPKAKLQFTYAPQPKSSPRVEKHDRQPNTNQYRSSIRYPPYTKDPRTNAGPQQHRHFPHGWTAPPVSSKPGEELVAKARHGNEGFKLDIMPQSQANRPIEIQLSNIPKSAGLDEVNNMLRRILHRPPFTNPPEKPLNFRVFLPSNNARGGRDREWSSHCGAAVLTLPTVTSAHRMLADYGSYGLKKLVLHQQRVWLAQAKSWPTDGLLDHLIKNDWLDPKEKAKRKREDEKLAQEIPITSVQFGRLCSNNRFSNEHAVEFNLKEEDGWLCFDRIGQCFRIGHFLHENVLKIHALNVKNVIALEKVNDVRGGARGGYPVVLILETNPSIEVRPDHSPALRATQAAMEVRPDDPDSVNEEPKGPRIDRLRASAFDSKHEGVAPFTLRHICLMLRSEEDVRLFDARGSMIGLPPYVQSSEVEIVQDKLYRNSGKNDPRKVLTRWLQELLAVPSSIALSFQLEKLFRNLVLTPAEILTLRPQVGKLVTEHGALLAAACLNHLGQDLEIMRHREKPWTAAPTDLIQLLKSAKSRLDSASRALMSTNRPDRLIPCYHVVMTPTGMDLEGPYPDQTNRVLRRYGKPDHFLRVSFLDEDQLEYRFPLEVNFRTFLESSVKRLLQDGFYLGARKWEFLGYSQSALKTRSLWFVTPFEMPNGTTINAEHIRASLGTFDKVQFSPSRYGARLAQAFTATDPSITLQPEQILYSKDVETEPDLSGQQLNFTDGCGKISAELMLDAWAALKKRSEALEDNMPSAIQFRLGGYKGVLVMDPYMAGKFIMLRPSQNKFDGGQQLELEICSAAFEQHKPGPMYLSRPLVKTLEDRGVEVEAFLDLQKSSVEDAVKIKTSLARASRVIERNMLGGSYKISKILPLIRTLNNLDDDPSSIFDEGGSFGLFVKEIVYCCLNHILRLIKQKARIQVPGGLTAIGVSDEWNFLKPGEIFCCQASRNGGDPRCLEGTVLISRPPTIHPGDVQLVRAIGQPPPGLEKLLKLTNVVIMSVQGMRPLSNCLGGGDLDGDLYQIIEQPELFPTKDTEPADYETVNKDVMLDRPCQTDDLIESFIGFFEHDRLGLIAHQHLLISDQTEYGSTHFKALELARIHSLAVDFPKTGRVVTKDQIPRPLVPLKPDFMMPEGSMGMPDHTLFYESKRALGQLFRNVDIESHIPADEMPQRMSPSPPAPFEDLKALNNLKHSKFALRVWDLVRQVRGPFEVDVDTLRFCSQLLVDYAIDLRQISLVNSLSRLPGYHLTEAEICSGTILLSTAQHRKRVNQIQTLNLQSADLVQGLEANLLGNVSPKDKVCRLFTAWNLAQYHLQEDVKFGAKSFGLVALKLLLHTLFDDIKASGSTWNGRRAVARAEF